MYSLIWYERKIQQQQQYSDGSSAVQADDCWGKGVDGGGTPSALSRARSLSIHLFRRVYVYYINAKRGSFRCSCNMAWAHENFRAHSQIHTHTHLHTQR